MDFTELINGAKDWGIAFAPKLLSGILLLIVGFWVIKRLVRVVERMLIKYEMDLSVAKFLSSLMSILLKIMIVLSAVGMFGVNTTSFVAIFGALSVGIGMAFNGSIGHFVSGVMLLIFKPIKVGDLVTIGENHTGTVESITAFSTVLETLDNKRIIIANSNVTSNTIINISGQGTIGVEMVFGIGYDDSIDRAKEIILAVGKACPYILDVPEHGVVVGELADSSVNLYTRPFCKSEHYYDTKFYMQEEIKKAFDNNDIGIPFPQMDIRMAST